MTFGSLYDSVYDSVYDSMSRKGRPSADAHVIIRLDSEEQEILRRAREITGKDTNGVIKAALRAYEKTLLRKRALEIFEQHGVVGAISGPRDLSETHKQRVDYSARHVKRS